jgi:hypothetical protein
VDREGEEEETEVVSSVAEMSNERITIVGYHPGVEVLVVGPLTQVEMPGKRYYPWYDFMDQYLATIQVLRAQAVNQPRDPQGKLAWHLEGIDLCVFSELWLIPQRFPRSDIPTDLLDHRAEQLDLK